MTTPSTPSILRSLRQLTPRRACSFTEALNLAERQAAKLCTLLAATHPSYQLTGITEDHLAQLPRIRVVHEPLPVSGMSHWNGREWIICLGSGDPEVRQRFTLLHEFKHIIDHGHTHWLYTGVATSRQTSFRGHSPPGGRQSRVYVGVARSFVAWVGCLAWHLRRVAIRVLGPCVCRMRLGREVAEAGHGLGCVAGA